MTEKRPLAVLFGAIAFLSIRPAFGAIPSAYEILPLPPLPGHFTTLATDINNDGTVVGVSSTDPITVEQSAQPTLWLEGQVVDPQLPFGTFARAVNEHGHTTGNLRAFNVSQHAFVWDGEEIQDIHSTGSDSFGIGINDADHLVGWFQTVNVPRSAFLWKDGATIPLGNLGGVESQAMDINESGLVVGSAETSNRSSRAFVWRDVNENDASDPGEMVQLPDLGLSSLAFRVNDHGHVAGFMLDETFHRQGAVWKDSNSFTLTGILPGTLDSELRDINNFGQAVGHSDATAFVWENGQMVDLNSKIPQDSGWALFRAVGVNDSGWIVGEGRLRGVETAFLLKPVPEPSSLMIVASSVTPLLMWLGRRARSS
jgi:probable HAF family extracellular repeat protein